MIEPKYRTFWRRYWAAVLDGAVVSAVVGLGNVLVYSESVAIWLQVGWYIIASFCFKVYVIVMHARYGQTLGKMAADVRVLDVSEAKLTARQAILREAVPIILTIYPVVYGIQSVAAGEGRAGLRLSPQMPWPAFWLTLAAGLGWFAAEMLTMLTNDKRRAIHDFIAGSVVVRDTAPPIKEFRGAA